jgi:hypothetical protein
LSCTIRSIIWPSESIFRFLSTRYKAASKGTDRFVVLHTFSHSSFLTANSPTVAAHPKPCS